MDKKKVEAVVSKMAVVFGVVLMLVSAFGFGLGIGYDKCTKDYEAAGE